MANQEENRPAPAGHSGSAEVPKTFKEVLQDELKCIKVSRRLRGLTAEVNGDSLIGLAFSGGGLRSATFNLGILQGLAQKGLLRNFDYLSTVSGGGYIGSWFGALTRRFVEKVPGASFRDVEQLLRSETSALRWLRYYSTFLTSRTGPVSSESWASLVTWLRNVFLNHLVVILGLFGLCSLLHSAILPLVRVETNGIRFLISGCVILFVACVSLAINVLQQSPPLALRRSLFQRLGVTATVTVTSTICELKGQRANRLLLPRWIVHSLSRSVICRSGGTTAECHKYGECISSTLYVGSGGLSVMPITDLYHKG